MIYEIRVYEAAEGKADAMRRRFLEVVAAKFFPRHGIELIGAFTSQTGAPSVSAGATTQSPGG